MTVKVLETESAAKKSSASSANVRRSSVEMHKAENAAARTFFEYAFPGVPKGRCGVTRVSFWVQR